MIMKITRREQHDKHITNKRIIEWAKTTSIEEMLRQKVLRWSGHVARMENDRLAKQLMSAWVKQGERDQQMQNARYRDWLADALRSREIDLNMWVPLAQDRNQWRELVMNKPLNAQKAGKGKGKGKKPTAAEAPPYVGAVKCTFPGCGKWCDGKQGLAKHVIRSHTEGTAKAEPYKCEKILHTGAMCGYTAIDKGSLTKHVSIVHAPGVVPVMCTTCNAAFLTNAARDQHTKRKHYKREIQSKTIIYA
jgi:transcription termination factor 2